MSEDVRIVTVTAENVAQEGFFCYKSKPKSEGYRRKQDWLSGCFEQGMRIKILYQGKRSFGFVEYMPGEHSWRAVDAPNYLVIHCLWVVGSGKGEGFASRLLGEVEADAKAQGKAGVAMVCSEGTWLAAPPVFLKNGFKAVAEAPPSFALLAKPFGKENTPSLPDNWPQRATAFGRGATVTYADQCPYTPDAVQAALDIFEQRGIPAKAVRFQTSAEARAKSPSPHGVFGITLDGELFCYHYLGKREVRLLDEKLAGKN